MSANPVNSWDARLLAASESAFATPVVPASVAAYAAQALEFISCTLGPSEAGVVRAKKDRNPGRGMQSAFVEGRVQQIPWNVQLAVKSRSAVDADPREMVLYKAAGLKRTQNVGTSLVLSPSATPIESGDFVSATLNRPLGAANATYESEQLRGCVATNLHWEGGDKEVMLKAQGNGVGKYVTGALDSITLASGAVTTLTCTATESYKLDPGYYICESEVIQVTVANPGGTSVTIARGALGTTAAAHTAKPLQALVPSGITYAGAPIAEPNAVCSFDGINYRVMSWTVDIDTGMDLLPGETGSKYIQGAKYGRYDVKIGAKMVFSGDAVALLGKAKARPSIPISLSQGVGTGGIWTFAAPYCEIVTFAVPDTANDIAIVDVQFRVRDNAGNDAFSITLT